MWHSEQGHCQEEGASAQLDAQRQQSERGRANGAQGGEAPAGEVGANQQQVHRREERLTEVGAVVGQLKQLLAEHSPHQAPGEEQLEAGGPGK